MLFGHLQFWGCSSLLTPKYPEPILLDAKSHVNIRYEYDDVNLYAPIKLIEGNPTAYRLGVYHRDKIASPLMEKIFFPGDTISIILPRNIFSEEELGNLAILTPLGDEYEQAEILFSMSSAGTIELPLTIIRKPPAVLTGTVLVRVNQTPVADALIILSDSSGRVSDTLSDNLGFFRFELQSYFINKRDLIMMVTTDGEYATWLQPIDFKGEKRLNQKVLLGASQEFLEQGMVYRINQDLTPFREGPENGSPIQFFLAHGEVFIVTKVAGERLYGYIETVNQEKSLRLQHDGWVLKKYLDLIP